MNYPDRKFEIVVCAKEKKNLLRKGWESDKEEKTKWGEGKAQ